MRTRSVAALAVVGLLIGGVQVDAHGGGGGFHGMGGHGFGRPSGFHGFHATGPVVTPATAAAIHAGVFYTVAAGPARDGNFAVGQVREGGHGDGFGDRRPRDGIRLGFGFPQRPGPALSQRRPVLNYYDGGGGNYYSNVPSDYGTAAPCAPEDQARGADCQG